MNTGHLTKEEYLFVLKTFYLSEFIDQYTVLKLMSSSIENEKDSEELKEMVLLWTKEKKLKPLEREYQMKLAFKTLTKTSTFDHEFDKIFKKTLALSRKK